MTVDDILGRLNDDPAAELADRFDQLHDRHWYSTRQRLIVATFPTPEHALSFDEQIDGRLAAALLEFDAELAIVAEP